MIHDRIKLLHTTMMVRWFFVIITWSYCLGKYPLQLEFYTLFLVFPTNCVLTFHFLIFVVVVVTQNDSCIITCMITDCLSTNTVLPILIDYQCLAGYRAKMMESLRTNIIETGYSRPVEGPTMGPGTVHVIIAEVMENLLAMVVKKNTTLAITDTESSNNQHASKKQLTNPSADSITSVDAQDLCVVMSPLEMHHM